MIPARFLRRYAAYSLDLLVVGLLAAPLLATRWGAARLAFDAHLAAIQARLLALFDLSLFGPGGPWESARRWADDPELRARLEALVAWALHESLLAAGTVVALAAVWFIAFEASTWQATPGKRALGMRVVRDDGARPEAWRVMLRFVAGAPSWLVLHLGHALAAWRRDRRALHDLVAGARVVLEDGVPEPLPGWAVSWLWLQAAAFFGVLGFVVLRYVQLFAEALDAWG